MAMETLKIKLIGTKPLLMSNPQMANPLNEYSKLMKEHTKKHHSKKTDEDYEKIQEIQFMASCYYDEKLGYYIPTENIEASIKKGATASRNGKKIAIAFSVDELRVALKTKAKKKAPTELWNNYNTEFADTRFVNINNSKVLRSRARFDQWELEFICTLDTEVMDRKDFLLAVQEAGLKHGIGDYRPKYGTFEFKVDLM